MRVRPHLPALPQVEIKVTRPSKLLKGPRDEVFSNGFAAGWESGFQNGVEAAIDKVIPALKKVGVDKLDIQFPDYNEYRRGLPSSTVIDIFALEA